jgi:signal recognition particle receptor subunit beta
LFGATKVFESTGLPVLIVCNRFELQPTAIKGRQTTENHENEEQKDDEEEEEASKHASWCTLPAQSE